MSRSGKRTRYRKLRCFDDIQQLRKRCLASIRDFYSEGKVFDTTNGKYIFRDNGASILAVAHLDVVQPEPRHFGYRKGEPNIVYNTQLDDRLGVWTILDVLPKLGINVDILLTEGEESCRSTAAYFESEKEYNWLIEFDRAGTDVVMYDYETTELVDILQKLGNIVGRGSYSDISVLEHLGVAGFNWGIGYQNGHSRDSHFRVSDYVDAMDRFNAFHAAYKDTKFHHEEDCYYFVNVEDDEWIRDMESKQQIGVSDDDEYMRLWQEKEDQRLWEEARWGQDDRLAWDDCFPSNTYYD